MIVSHKRRFIFFHNPKCDGTAFRSAIRQFHDDPVTFWGPQDVPYFRNRLDHTHLRLWELAVAHPALFRSALGDYRSLIFVRNPYRRFLSAVAEHFKKYRCNVRFETLSHDEQTALVVRFIERELTIERITCDWTAIHFSPQIWFILFGDSLVPRTILPLDTDGSITNEAFDALGLPPIEVSRINASPYDLRHLLSVGRIVSFIEDFYELDFAFLQSLPRVAALAVRPPSEAQ